MCSDLKGVLVINETKAVYLDEIDFKNLIKLVKTDKEKLISFVKVIPVTEESMDAILRNIDSNIETTFLIENGYEPTI